MSVAYGRGKSFASVSLLNRSISIMAKGLGWMAVRLGFSQVSVFLILCLRQAVNGRIDGLSILELQATLLPHRAIYAGDIAP